MANHYPGILKAGAEAAMRSAIGSIPGCHVGAVRVVVPKGAGANVAAAHMNVTGWSPSLHRIGAVWRCMIPAGDDEDAQLRTMRAVFDSPIGIPVEGAAAQLLAQQVVDVSRMGIQRRRAAEGVSLGFAAPLRTNEDDGRIIPGRVDHVMVDRGLARLMEEAEPGSFLRDVGDSLFQLNLTGEPVRDGTEEQYHGEMIAEPGKESSGSHGIDGRTLHRDHHIGPDATYDGRALTLRRAVPEAVLAAAVGRTLGEVADVPAAIAGHRILAAQGYMVTLPSTIIDVEPDLATVAEIIGGPEKRT